MTRRCNYLETIVKDYTETKRIISSEFPPLADRSYYEIRQQGSDLITPGFRLAGGDYGRLCSLLYRIRLNSALIELSVVMQTEDLTFFDEDHHLKDVMKEVKRYVSNHKKKRKK